LCFSRWCDVLPGLMEHTGASAAVLVPRVDPGGFGLEGRWDDLGGLAFDDDSGQIGALDRHYQR